MVNVTTQINLNYVHFGDTSYLQTETEIDEKKHQVSQIGMFLL